MEGLLSTGPTPSSFLMSSLSTQGSIHIKRGGFGALVYVLFLFTFIHYHEVHRALSKMGYSQSWLIPVCYYQDPNSKPQDGRKQF